jgi:hypothetical protein
MLNSDLEADETQLIGYETILESQSSSLTDRLTISKRYDHLWFGRANRLQELPSVMTRESESWMERFKSAQRSLNS